MDKERVGKFATLIKTGDAKYSCMTQLARLILKLLGTAVDDSAAPDTYRFADFDQFKLQLNTRDPLTVTNEEAKTLEQTLNDSKDKFTNKGSPKEFKKVFKYDSLHNWASKFVEVVLAAHNVEKGRVELNDLKVTHAETQIKIENFQECL